METENPMKTCLLLTAALMTVAGTAMASITADQLIAAYQAKGFTGTSATTRLTRIQIGASLRTNWLNVDDDIAAVAILRQMQSSDSRSADVIFDGLGEGGFSNHGAGKVDQTQDAKFGAAKLDYTQNAGDNA